MSARMTRIAGVLLFIGMWSIVLVVTLPVLYSFIMAGAGILEIVPVMISLGIGFEWVLSSVLTLSLCMMVGD